MIPFTRLAHATVKAVSPLALSLSIPAPPVSSRSSRTRSSSESPSPDAQRSASLPWSEQGTKPALGAYQESSICLGVSRGESIDGMAMIKQNRQTCEHVRTRQSHRSLFDESFRLVGEREWLKETSPQDLWSCEYSAPALILQTGAPVSRHVSHARGRTHCTRGASASIPLCTLAWTASGCCSGDWERPSVPIDVFLLPFDMSSGDSLRRMGSHCSRCPQLSPRRYRVLNPVIGKRMIAYVSLEIRLFTA